MRPISIAWSAWGVLAFGIAFGQVPPGREGEAVGMGEDSATLRLLRTAGAVAPGPGARKAFKDLHKMESDKLTAVVMYALSDDSLRRNAVRFVLYSAADGRPLHGLARPIAEHMRRCNGRELMTAVRIANYAPDPAYLAPLVEHALDSDYAEEVLGPLEAGGRRSRHISVFRDAAVALHKITDGEIGAQIAWENRDKAVPGKAEMIAQWRRWWEDHKTKDREAKPQAEGSEQAVAAVHIPQVERSHRGAGGDQAALKPVRRAGSAHRKTPEPQTATGAHLTWLTWSHLLFALAAAAVVGAGCALSLRRRRVS